MSMHGYLGIDVGTQGLSVVFVDSELRFVATGEGSYDMIGGLPEGQYEQCPRDWEEALYTALRELRTKMHAIDSDWHVRAIGISAQMHGEVLTDAAGEPLGPARIWCDTRNEDEGMELSEAFGVKIPKRLTIARWLWTVRTRPEVARKTEHLSTPGGWLAYRLTGQWNTGIGDAAGMFPVDPRSNRFDEQRIECFDSLTPGAPASLAALLPAVRRAGEDGGTLNDEAARKMGLPEGIPVAPAEGDQPAAMAGSFLADPGMVSMSFGTSVCANVVSDRSFQGSHPGIDHFCTVDGKQLHIAWLRNGTTFMNRIIDMFTDESGDPTAAFSRIMPRVCSVPPDCDGLMALPFLDDEPGHGVSRAGTAWIGGLSHANTTPAHLAKAALMATVYNLKCTLSRLLDQGFPIQSIVLSGGLTRTPELGGVVADVFERPVELLECASEASAFGAALLGAYRWRKMQGDTTSWISFLREHAPESPTRFTPDPKRVEAYRNGFERHGNLLRLHGDWVKTQVS